MFNALLNKQTRDCRCKWGFNKTTIKLQKKTAISVFFYRKKKLEAVCVCVYINFSFIPIFCLYSRIFVCLILYSMHDYEYIPKRN